MHLARYCLVAAALVFCSFLLCPVDALESKSSGLRPSFPCDGPLIPAERVICENTDLVAFDRAVAWAFVRKRESHSTDIKEQNLWLKRRNACDDNYSCLAQTYRDWFQGLDQIIEIGPRFARTGGQSGNFRFRQVGDGWFLFQADAIYVYDSANGKGPNFSDSSASGVVHMEKGKAFWDSEPGHAGSCKVEMTKLSQRAWRLVEIDRGCSGLGSTLSGTYRRSR